MSAHGERYIAEVRDVLVQAWPTRGGARSRVRPAVGHALEFGTWRSLVRAHGRTAREAVELMVTFVSALGEPA
jgi:hypothetical protein